MNHVIVRYKVKPDRADENQRLIEDVFAELESGDPGGLRYASFRLADGVSFVHVASIESAERGNPLSESAAFVRFTADIAARCDEPPAPQEAHLVGSYGLF